MNLKMVKLILIKILKNIFFLKIILYFTCEEKKYVKAIMNEM